MGFRFVAKGMKNIEKNVLELRSSLITCLVILLRVSYLVRLLRVSYLWIANVFMVE